jgi:hypothetical protein
MSLLNTASPWNADSSNNKSKTKRKSSLNESNIDSSEPLKEAIKVNDERTSQIHKLLNEMHELDENEDTNQMESFEPLPNPHINIKPNEQEGFSNMKEVKFHPNLNNNSEKLSNYSTIYNQPQVNDPNLEGFMNIPNNSNDMLLEKINYMIHMLEQQQHEKTSNITEEFILYSFLGIFVIYIVDSFSRVGGKYKR